jgi:hypothetical protein
LVMQITYENCLCCTFIRKILRENTQSIQLCKSSELWVKNLSGAKWRC